MCVANRKFFVKTTKMAEHGLGSHCCQTTRLAIAKLDLEMPHKNMNSEMMILTLLMVLTMHTSLPLCTL